MVILRGENIVSITAEAPPNIQVIQISQKMNHLPN